MVASHLTFVEYYDQELDPALVKALAEIQVQAIHERIPPEKGSDQHTDLALTHSYLEEFFQTNPHYTLAVAFQGNQPVGWIAGAENEADETENRIHGFYARRGTKAGNDLFRLYKENLPTVVTDVKALPLEGSEPVYRRLGFNKQPNTQVFSYEFD